MTERLDDLLVQDALQGLPAWTGDGNGITRAVQVAGPEADHLIASVGETAEAMDHHPDVTRDGDNVTFLLTTHSAGGVTTIDIAMASVIEDLVAAATGDEAQHGHHEVTEAAMVPSRDDEEPSVLADQDREAPLMGQPSGGAGGPATMLPSSDPGAPEPGVAVEQEPDRHS